MTLGATRDWYVSHVRKVCSTLDVSLRNSIRKRRERRQSTPGCKHRRRRPFVTVPAGPPREEHTEEERKNRRVSHPSRVDMGCPAWRANRQGSGNSNEYAASETTHTSTGNKLDDHRCSARQCSPLPCCSGLNNWFSFVGRG